jgi:recombinational DNA repair protein RecT
MQVKLGDGKLVDADVLDALAFALLKEGFNTQEIVTKEVTEEVTKKVREYASDESTLLNALKKHKV